MVLRFSISKEALAAKIDALFPTNEFSDIYESYLRETNASPLPG